MSASAPADQMLGIIELGAVCASMRARNLALFEQLGSWVVDTPDPTQQRAFGEACHRHAWHAELWEQRSPSIPAVETEPRPVVPAAGFVVPDARVAAYTREVDQLLAELDVLTARIEPVLDPSTVRVIDLVRADLIVLRQRLAADREG